MDVLLQFGVKTILLGLLIVACFCAFAVYRNLIAYCLISTLLPAVIGLSCRYQFAKSDVSSTVAAFSSSIPVSAFLMAYGSYFRTFIDPAPGILIGDGWSSVFAAAMFGAITGTVCGLFSMLFYTFARASVELVADYRDDS